jgi:hypothetical protein
VCFSRLVSALGADGSGGRVLGATATQFEVFHEVRPLVQSALDGFNVSILAYGQTGVTDSRCIPCPSGS